MKQVIFMSLVIWRCCWLKLVSSHLGFLHSFSFAVAHLSDVSYPFIKVALFILELILNRLLVCSLLQIGNSLSALRFLLVVDLVWDIKCARISSSGSRLAKLANNSRDVSCRSFASSVTSVILANLNTQIWFGQQCALQTWILTSAHKPVMEHVPEGISELKVLKRVYI